MISYLVNKNVLANDAAVLQRLAKSAYVFHILANSAAVLQCFGDLRCRTSMIWGLAVLSSINDLANDAAVLQCFGEWRCSTSLIWRLAV